MERADAFLCRSARIVARNMYAHSRIKKGEARFFYIFFFNICRHGPRLRQRSKDSRSYKPIISFFATG